MQVVKCFELDKGFCLVIYVMWWIKVVIQEYILRFWLLVKMGIMVNQKCLFFNFWCFKGKIQVFDEGDLKLYQVKEIVMCFGVFEDEVILMNWCFGGDVSLNVFVCVEVDVGEWQDWFVDESDSQEMFLVNQEEFDMCCKMFSDVMGVLNDCECCIFEVWWFLEDLMIFEDLLGEFGVSCECVWQIEVWVFEKV